MSISIIDTLEPLGRFPVAKAKDVEVESEGKRLDEVIEELEAGKGGTKKYPDLENKPQINGFELNGNKSSADLGINIPTKVSELQNDSGYIKNTDSRLTDARPASDVSSWAKQPTKPSYTASEVGALPSNTKIPEKTSQLQNDSGFANISEVNAVNDRVTNIKTEQAALSERMNTFTRLEEGSTTGDAELMDGRISYNGKENENIGEAIRSQAKYFDTNIKNIFNQNEIIKADSNNTKLIKNKYIHYDGREMTSSLDFAYATDFIEIEPGQEIKFSVWNVPSPGAAGIAYYDNEKTCIGGIAYAKSSSGEYELIEKVVTPLDPNYKYIRITVYDKSAFYIKTSDISLFNSINDNTNNVNLIENCVPEVLWDKNNTVYVKNKYVKWSDGTLSDSQLSDATDFIKIEPDEEITVTMPRVTSAGASGYAYYDENKKFLNGIGYQTSTSGQIDMVERTFIPMSGAKYMRFSVYDRENFRIIHKSNFTKKIEEITNVNDKLEGTYISDKCSDKSINMSYENGSFDGSGGKISSDVSVRISNAIKTKPGAPILVTFPDGITCTINYKASSWTQPANISYTEPFVITNNSSDKIMIAFKFTDGTSIQGVFNNYKEKIHIWTGFSSATECDISVAASNSLDSDKIKADIILNGENDTDVIQAIFGCERSIKCLLYPGVYNVTKIHKTKYDKPCAFSTIETSYDSLRVIELVGAKTARLYSKNQAVRFVVSNDLHNKISEETAIFLCPRRAAEEDTELSYNTAVKFSNIIIHGQDYDKPIVYLDFTQAKACEIEGCEIRSESSYSGLPKFNKVPNEFLTGIRVGHGSNNGTQNYIKNTSVMYCYTGVSNCGEHFVFEDVLCHHCYDAFAFGDRLTRGNFEHPNIMIGCSVEGSRRLMTLNRYGATSESTADKPRNTLICIGLSTETLFYNVESGNEESTLPIKEMIKGAYRGRIEADFGNSRETSPFEEGSGTKMKYTIYNSAGTFEG